MKTVFKMTVKSALLMSLVAIVLLIQHMHLFIGEP